MHNGPQHSPRASKTAKNLKRFENHHKIDVVSLGASFFLEPKRVHWALLLDYFVIIFGVTDRQIDRQTDRQADRPIDR